MFRLALLALVAYANADCALPAQVLTIPAGQAMAHCCLGLDGHADIVRKLSPMCASRLPGVSLFTARCFCCYLSYMASSCPFCFLWQSFGMTAQSQNGDQFSLSVSASVDTGTGVCAAAPYWRTYGPWSVSIFCPPLLAFSSHNSSSAQITSPIPAVTSSPRPAVFTSSFRSSSHFRASNLVLAPVVSLMSLKRCAMGQAA